MYKKILFSLSALLFASMLLGMSSTHASDSNYQADSKVTYIAENDNGVANANDDDDDMDWGWIGLLGLAGLLGLRRRDNNQGK